MKKFSAVIVALLTVLGVLTAAEFEIRVESSSKTGWVKSGEKVRVRAAAFLDGQPLPEGYVMRVALWKDGGSYKKLTVPAEKGYVTELSLDKPGWASVSFALRDPKKEKEEILLKKKQRMVGTGIVLDPSELQVVRPEPADFDAFWNANKKELAGVPLKVLEKKEVPLPGRIGELVACYDVKLACVGPKPVSGYLCVPRKAGKKYPVILGVDGAGVRNSWKSPNPDAVTFYINAHGILNGQAPEYYKKLAGKELRGYPYFGADARETIYFKYMFLRVLRALEYVKSLPEWNGRDIIVRGSSQGGAQTLFAAAMDKDVTLAVASVPAMCDFAGCLAAPVRQSGWPRPYRRLEKDSPKPAAWDYYDGVNFARRITCPVYISTGFMDMTCVPTSVFCMFNQLASKEKHMETHRDMGHSGRNDAGNAAIMKILGQGGKKN
ncbi:MAG: acetylxylan esterase [Lentisphaeria bacterium]|nr:acetylxylan esterase [Lentisphaeria bacterium]